VRRRALEPLLTLEWREPPGAHRLRALPSRREADDAMHSALEACKGARAPLRPIQNICTGTGVPLQVIETAHVRVVCDSCRVASAEVCGKRDLPTMARVAAVRKFKSVGWHNDVGEHTRTRTLEQAERDGSGRWYCPTCARKTHL
jgi:hypothetical protein